MAFTVTMPKLSPTMESGIIAKWHVKEGDFVDADQLLIEVATDKATVEYNALDPGYIRKIIVKEGQEAKVNDPLAILTEKADDPFDDVVITKAPVVETALKKVEEVAIVRDTSGLRVFASPLAKKLARDRGIDLTQIKGSGPSGRIMSRDLTTTSAPIVGGTLEPLTQIRKVIASKLQASKMQIPHFYVRQKMYISKLLTLRQQLKDTGTFLTINDFIVKAVALALKEHPNINSGFSEKDQAIIRFDNIDLSIAMDVKSGLITPIVKNADKLPISEIASEIKRLGHKAKEGKLALAEFQGGSFSISNLGMFGITDFTAIINPPQGAILAIGGIENELQLIDGQIQQISTMMMTLSVDHRVIDGAQAAQFLKTLKKQIESPAHLMN